MQDAGSAATLKGDSSLSRAREIDACCDRFEAHWRSTPRPTVEAVLALAPETLRPTLLIELVALEVALRRADGEHPTAAEYRGRFPELGTKAEALVDGVDAPRGPGDSDRTT